ncbi:MAG: hypothetical protein FJ398_17700 [Verrucomicrobia bacterium]|nr:hypothetical protein [Verrucomicrobiota bacterium]
MRKHNQVETGVAWYSQDQYSLLRALAADADSLHPTYEEWRAAATKLIEDLRSKGVTAYKVDVDVHELAAWCKREGRPFDGAARATFVSKIQRDSA